MDISRLDDRHGSKAKAVPLEGNIIQVSRKPNKKNLRSGIENAVGVDCPGTGGSAIMIRKSHWPVAGKDMRVGPFGLPELLIILVVILLIFGAKRLPEIGSSLGRGIRTFKTAVTGEDDNPPPERHDRQGVGSGVEDDRRSG